MKKSLILSFFLCVLHTFNLFPNDLNGFYFIDTKEKITDGYYEFEPQGQDIFCFDKHEGKLLFVTSRSNITKYKAVKDQPVFWYSENEKLRALVKDSFVSGNEVVRSHRNSSMLRALSSGSFGVYIAVAIIACVAFARVFFKDAFYVLLVPFKSYSSTIEKVAQTSRSTVFVSVLFLVFLIFAFILLLKPSSSLFLAFYYLCLVSVSFFLKWLFLNRVNAVFGDHTFGRVHLLEFLRYSVFVFTVIYFLALIVALNDFKIDFIYEILLFPFAFIWFIRLFIVYNKRYNHNFLYFFCYLCATEVLPILLLVFFWKEK